MYVCLFELRCECKRHKGKKGGKYITSTKNNNLLLSYLFVREDLTMREKCSYLTKTPVTNKVIKIPVALNDIAPIAQIDCGRM